MLGDLMMKRQMNSSIGKGGEGEGRCEYSTSKGGRIVEVGTAVLTDHVYESVPPSWNRDFVTVYFEKKLISQTRSQSFSYWK
jgi:hypothetical protein